MSTENQHGLIEGQALDKKDGIVLPESHDVRHYAYFAKIHDESGKRLIGTAMVDDLKVMEYTQSLDNRKRLPEVDLKITRGPEAPQPPMRRPFVFRLDTTLQPPMTESPPRY